MGGTGWTLDRLCGGQGVDRLCGGQGLWEQLGLVEREGGLKSVLI